MADGGGGGACCLIWCCVMVRGVWRSVDISMEVVGATVAHRMNRCRINNAPPALPFLERVHTLRSGEEGVGGWQHRDGSTCGVVYTCNVRTRDTKIKRTRVEAQVHYVVCLCVQIGDAENRS